MSAANHLLGLSPADQRAFLDSFDFVIFDCDGVLWKISDPLPGTREALQLLRDVGKTLRFVTNNSTRDWTTYENLFSSIGVQLTKVDLVHPMRQIINYLHEIAFDGLIYCIGRKVAKDYLREGGLEVIDGPHGLVEENIFDVLKEIWAPTERPVRAVVTDMDFSVDYTKIGRAAWFLREPECLFLVGGCDRKMPISDDYFALGPGYFSDMIEEHSGRKPIVLSKPSKFLAERIIKEFDIKDPKRVLFVGDALEQDMGFAGNAGFQKLLVFSGATKPEDLERNKNQALTPDYVADSLNDFVKLFASL